MSSEPDSGSPAAPTRNPTALALLVAGTFFMENLDATVITPAVPSMARSFAVAPVDLNIGISAYLLTLGVLIPASGWIAERYGPRRVFASAIALFTLASLLCGLASSLPYFLLARIAQGVGGALMVPVGRLTVLKATPKDRLVKAIATLTWPALVAPVLGPPVGGWISQHADWRWIFWLNLPLGLIALLLAVRLVPSHRGDKATRFDWPGFVLTSGGLCALLFAAELMGRRNIDWGLAVPSLVAGATLVVLSVRHMRRTAHPMVQLGGLEIPSFAVTIGGGALFCMGVSAVPFLVPLMLQIGLGWSATDAGLMLMAVFAGNLAMKPMTTAIMRRLGFRRVLIGNGIINAAGIAACGLIALGLPVPAIAAVLFVGGMARSLQFTALNSIAFAEMPEAKMTGANTLFSTTIQLSMGLGIALGAISWRLATAFVATSPAAPFAAAFVLVAFASGLGTFHFATLKSRVGTNVLGN